MAARPDRCSTCSTRSARPSAPRPGSTMPSPRARRLMGFGHRIYKVRDPRADVLKNTVATLPQTAGRLAFAVEVEKQRHRGAAQAQAGAAARHQRRVLHGAAARGAGDPAQRLHRAVRRRPRRRLVRAHLRAGEGRPHHPAAIELCRAATRGRDARHDAPSSRARCGRACRWRRTPRRSRRRRPT